MWVGGRGGLRRKAGDARVADHGHSPGQMKLVRGVQALDRRRAFLALARASCRSPFSAFPFVLRGSASPRLLRRGIVVPYRCRRCHRSFLLFSRKPSCPQARAPTVEKRAQGTRPSITARRRSISLARSSPRPAAIWDSPVGNAPVMQHVGCGRGRPLPDTANPTPGLRATALGGASAPVAYTPTPARPQPCHLFYLWIPPPCLAPVRSTRGCEAFRPRGSGGTPAARGPPCPTSHEGLYAVGACGFRVAELRSFVCSGSDPGYKGTARFEGRRTRFFHLHPRCSESRDPTPPLSGSLGGPSRPSLYHP